MRKYNDTVMEALRERIGVDGDDASCDEEIMKMDKHAVFQEYCLWNGLTGDDCDILLSVVENIYGLALRKKKF